ncbi:MAG: hypothetical protein ACRD2N_05780 [Vicinamibacterales bacterium]
MDSAHRGALNTVLRDLQLVFGERLTAFLAYGDGRGDVAPSLALVGTLSAEDLSACAARAKTWHSDGAATPLLLTRDEFVRSLDAFPIEYGEILDTRHVMFGVDPFTGLTIRPDDVRRACEVQVKSHLLHLRENYVECGARPSEVARLVADSAPAFEAVLRRMARLDDRPARTPAEIGAYAASRPGIDPRVVGDVIALVGNGNYAPVNAARLFPEYLAAVEQLWRFIDRWNAR